MKIKSRIVVVIAASFAVMVQGITPLYAQPQEPLLHEQLFDGARGLFNKLFGGSDAPVSRPAEPAEPQAPRADPPRPAPVAAEKPPAQSTPAIAPTPTALTQSRSLHEAVVRGDAAAARSMLDQGADIESKDPGSGASPLHYAVMKGRMEIVDLLLARGADVNSRTRNGTTPLHTAALYSRREVAARLIEKRADLNAVSASGATPLALANAAKNRPIEELLRSSGAK